MAQARRSNVGSAGRGSVGRKTADVMRRAWNLYWTRRAEHATVAILHALDDRTLKDIGLDRSEIESVAHATSPGQRRIGRTYSREGGALGCC